VTQAEADVELRAAEMLVSMFLWDARGNPVELSGAQRPALDGLERTPTDTLRLSAWIAAVQARHPELQKAVTDLLSLATTQANTEEKLAGLLCCLPQAFVPETLGYANSFRVVILQFLDRYNFDLATVKRSCVHFVTPDQQIIPFDTYNTFYRPGAEGAAVVKRARGSL
jgi:hypothetical protein